MPPKSFTRCLFQEDFKSLTLIDAGIPGVTLMNDIQLSDYKRQWNFIFQMLPDLPAVLIKGKEDLCVGWWFKQKVYRPGAIPPEDVAAYVAAYAREGRMDAAFDYCRKVVEDMDFNKTHFKNKLPIRLLAVGGQHSIPNMGEWLKPYFFASDFHCHPRIGSLRPGRAAGGAGEGTALISELEEAWRLDPFS